MRESITFLIMWLVFVLIEFIGSVIMHSEISIIKGIEWWFRGEVLYALLAGWCLSGLIIFLMYVKSLSMKKKNEEAKEKAKEKVKEKTANK